METKISKKVVAALDRLRKAKREWEKYPEDKGTLDELTDAQYNLLDLL